MYKLSTLLTRLTLTVILLYFSYLETGAATVIILSLVLLNVELCAYIKYKEMKHHMSVADKLLEATK